VQAGVRTLDASLGASGAARSRRGDRKHPDEDLVTCCTAADTRRASTWLPRLPAGRWLQDAARPSGPGMLVKAGDFPAAATRVA